jgi:hypothetical protein
MINPNFRDTLRYHCRAEPSTLLGDLKELRVRSEAARTRRKVWIWSLVAWLIACFYFCAMTANALVCLGVFLGLVGLIAGIVLIKRAGRMILPERRRKLAVAVVRALACDLRPGGKIELGVNFHDYHQPYFQSVTSPLGAYTASIYRLPWLEVSARLAGGSQVMLGLELVCRRRERSKTKGRKKIKEEMRERVIVTIRVPRMPDGAAERWPEQMRSLPLPPSTTLHRARVKNDQLSLELRTFRQVRVTNKGSVVSGADIDDRLANRHTLLMPMLAAYQALAGCR